MITIELLGRLTDINTLILTGALTHPAKFAVLLEDLAGDAWEEARESGEATWDEAEDLQSAIRIDP